MSEDEMKKDENIEHEVIDRLKYLHPFDFDYNAVDNSYVDAMLKARNIILDLYQQEKEKNGILQNELEKRQWVKIKDNGEIEPLFYISKGKISAKIKEIEDLSFSTEEERDCQCYAIEQLKELMEN